MPLKNTLFEVEVSAGGKHDPGTRAHTVLYILFVLAALYKPQVSILTSRLSVTSCTNETILLYISTNCL